MAKKSFMELFDTEGVKQKMKSKDVSYRAALAEFIAMTFFVFIGCGTAVMFSTIRDSTFADGSSADSEATNKTDVGGELLKLRNDLLGSIIINASFGIITALAFGMAIMTLVYAVAHISGGQLNPAVSFSLFLSGNLGWVQLVANTIAQFAGALLAAGFVWGITPDAEKSSLGSNSPAVGIGNGEAVLGEIICTALLCFVVHMTAVHGVNTYKVGNMAPLAIGFAVFLGHAVLLPVDGCSINPARSFGPAALSGDWAGGRFWIFVVGPYVGAIFGVLCYLAIAKDWETEWLGRDIDSTDDVRPSSAVDKGVGEAVEKGADVVDSAINKATTAVTK